MDVNINNLRIHTAFALDDVIKVLNRGIMPERAYESFNRKSGQVTQVMTYAGNILVDTDDLQYSIDTLRSCVWNLLCVFNPDDPEFKAVYEDVIKEGGLACFNPEMEDVK